MRAGPHSYNVEVKCAPVMHEAFRSQNNTGGQPQNEIALIKTYRTPGRNARQVRWKDNFQRILEKKKKKHGDKI